MIIPFALLFLSNVASSAKIAIFTAPISTSQQIFNNRLAEALIDGDHEVTIIRPLYSPTSKAVKPKNYKIKDIGIMAVENPEYMANYSALTQKQVFEDLSFSEGLELSKAMTSMLMKACSTMLSNKDFMDAIEKENFDIALHHHVDFCTLGIIHKVGIPKWIYTLAGPPYRTFLNDIGVPVLPSLLPGILTDAPYPMNFFNRMKSFLFEVLMDVWASKIISGEQSELFRKHFGRSFPCLNSLRKTARLGMINADQIVEYPVPTNQKTVFIGGLGMEEPNKLQEPFSTFVKNRKVVVVSFGSVVNTTEMPQLWIDAFVDMFRQNPDIGFVLKFDKDISLPPNVLKSTWLPQSDLLAEESVVAFITHGGYNSLMEAVTRGKPLLVVPLFADQYRNARLAEYRGFGVYLSKHNISSTSLNENLEKLINDERYLKTANQLKTIISGRPVRADEMVRYHVDFALKHEIDLAIPPLSLIELYNMDVVLFLFALLATLLFFIKKLLGCYYWSCCEMAYKEKVKFE